MENARFKYDVPQNLPLNKFVYKGYLFKGWYDTHNDATYYDGQQVENLTGVDGMVITLKAIWEICPHNDSSLYSYTANDNVITLNCKCQGYHKTATIKANDTVYDGEEHCATVSYYSETINGLKPTSEWTVSSPSYEGDRLGTDPAPIKAGTYTAKITANNGAVVAQKTYIIDKAQQLPPGKPTYETTRDAGGNITNVNIKYNAIDESNKSKIEYRLVYYSGDMLVDTPWQDSNEIKPTVVFTNYIVMVRFKGDDDHYPSPESHAETTFYYAADILIHVSICDGFSYRLEKQTGGLDIFIDVWEGYYKSHEFNIGVETKKTVSGDTPQVDYITAAQISNMYSEVPVLVDIPASGDGAIYDIYLTIVGAKKFVTVTANIDSGREFEQVTEDDASITNDSAYSVYFEVNNYEGYKDLALSFNDGENTVNLPQNTTIALRDISSNSYWYYKFNSAVSSVPLNQFVEMGELSNKFVVLGATLRYQFVIDFSQCETAYSSAKLETELIASIVDEYKTNNSKIPEFNTRSVAVIADIEQEPKFAINKIDDGQDDLEVNLSVSYALTQNNAISSKWENRKGSLVFTYGINPIDLPNDACIKVIEPNRTTIVLKNSNGDFVVPISNIGVTRLTVVLSSSTFPQGKATYNFEVKLVASQSVSGNSVANGEVMDTKSIVFTVLEDAQPSVSIKQFNDETNLIFKTDDVINILVSMENVSAVTVSLMMKNEQGEYNSTGWTQKTITSDEQDKPLAISLAGQIEGSYCIMVTVKNEAGETILSVPYYFIISNSAV